MNKAALKEARAQLEIGLLIKQTKLQQKFRLVY